MKILLLAVALPYLVWAQTNYPGSLDTDENLKVLVNGVQTILTSPLSSGASTASVASCTGIVANTMATINTTSLTNQEIVAILSCSGTTITFDTSSPGCTSGRGCDGTTPKSHSQNELFSLYLEAYHGNVDKSALKAIENSIIGTGGFVAGISGAIAQAAINTYWSPPPVQYNTFGTINPSNSGSNDVPSINFATWMQQNNGNGNDAVSDLSACVVGANNGSCFGMNIVLGNSPSGAPSGGYTNGRYTGVEVDVEPFATPNSSTYGFAANTYNVQNPGIAYIARNGNFAVTAPAWADSFYSEGGASSTALFAGTRATPPTCSASGNCISQNILFQSVDGALVQHLGELFQDQSGFFNMNTAGVRLGSYSTYFNTTYLPSIYPSGISTANLAANDFTGAGNTNWTYLGFASAAFNDLTGSVGNVVGVWGAGIARSTGSTVFGANFLALAPSGVSSPKLVGTEIDVEPASGVTPASGSAGLYINGFNSAIPGAAIQIGGVSSGTFANGIGISGIASNGAALYVPGGASSMASFINTTNGSFTTDAIALGNSQGVQFYNTGSGFARIWNDSSNNLHIVPGTTGNAIFRNAADTASTGNAVAGTFQMTGTSQPTCSGTTLGSLWYSGHTSSVTDSAAICTADSSNAYAFRSVINSAGTQTINAGTNITTSGTCSGANLNCTVASSGGGSAQHYRFTVACQNTLAAAAFSWPATNGASPLCDSAWSSMDGYMSFTNGTTQYALVGPIYLDSSFVDGVTPVVWYNTTATSGTFIPSISALCVSSGGAITTTWWTGASYTNFSSSTVAGTASQVKSVTTASSYTTGCSAGNLLYIALRWASGSGTLASPAQVKMLDLAATW